MPRELKSAEEIQAQVSQLLHSYENVKDDAAWITVPEPTRLQETDETGCNWIMMVFGNSAGYEGEISSAVQHIQSISNLKS